MQLSLLLAVLAVVAPSQAFFCEYQEAEANYANVGRGLIRIYQSNALSGFWSSCSTQCANNSWCLGWTWEYNKKSTGVIVLAKCVFYKFWVYTYNERKRTNRGKLAIRDRGSYTNSDYACGGYYFSRNISYWKLVKKSTISNETTSADFEEAEVPKTDEAIMSKRWVQSDFPLVEYANPDATNYADPNDYSGYYDQQLGYNTSNSADVWIV